MRRQNAMILALGLGLVAALGTAPAARAEEQIHDHRQMAAPHAPAITSPAEARQQSGGVKLNVTSLNDSGISGTATLRALDGDKVEVGVLANGAGADPLPIHIHEGACADLNPVPKIPLTTVANGVSTTEVDGALQQLTAAPHAIFLHKSPEELPIFVACADITLAGQLSALPSAGDAGVFAEVASGLSGVGLALAGAGYVLRRRARRLYATMRRGAA